MLRVDLEQVEDAYVVGAVAFDVNKHLLMRASYKGGIEFVVGHWHYPELITRDPEEAMNFYNNDPPPPAPADRLKVHSDPKFEGIKRVYQPDNEFINHQN